MIPNLCHLSHLRPQPSYDDHTATYVQGTHSLLLTFISDLFVPTMGGVRLNYGAPESTNPLVISRGGLPAARVHQSCGARSHAATPPTAQNSARCRYKRGVGNTCPLFCSVPVDGLACPKIRSEGYTVTDRQSKSVRLRRTVGDVALARRWAWTSEALSAPVSRHMSGEAWPREHMQPAEQERSRTCRGASRR
jgi:hypothetical protein